MRRRATSSLTKVPVAIALGDRAVVLDNSGRAHRQLLGIEGGRIVFQDSDLPRWLRGLLPRIADALVPTA